ncbi:hypothetical protein MNBD_GAMMA10-2212 [hydrothermal vent metagenome]|uniref:Uncharacterized protein n=1 Tax=hydrothermal vent metagenome TaxID=652676 RepID=A0A3B0Y6F8_9ZZZZ
MVCSCRSRFNGDIAKIKELIQLACLFARSFQHENRYVERLHANFHAENYEQIFCATYKNQLTAQ